MKDNSTDSDQPYAQYAEAGCYYKKRWRTILFKFKKFSLKYAIFHCDKFIKSFTFDDEILTGLTDFDTFLDLFAINHGYKNPF